MIKNFNRFVALFLVAMVAMGMAIACRGSLPEATAPSAPPNPSADILVAAAASLQDAIEAIDPLFESAQAQATATYTFAASGALQEQIEQGAPVDVFISAASRQMDSLEEQDLLVPESRRNLLKNRLVIVVPANSSANLASFEQLAEPSIQRIAVGEPRSVPVGQYTEEVMRNLNILETVRPKLVYGNSVRNVLAAVETENADAGVVYATDAMISDQVKQVAIAPENLHSPIVYPVAIMRQSAHPESAQAYLDFLEGEQARQIFLDYGFSLVED